MIWLDWVLLVVWLGLALSGFWKGAVRIVFGLGGFLAGVALAVAAGPELAARIQGSVGIEWLAEGLARLLPVLLCVLLGFLAGWGFERTLQAMHLGWLNRLTGAALTGVVGALLLGVLLLTGTRVSPAWARECGRSQVAQLLISVPALILPPEAARAVSSQVP